MIAGVRECERARARARMSVCVCARACMCVCVVCVCVCVCVPALVRVLMSLCCTTLPFPLSEHKSTPHPLFRNKLTAFSVLSSMTIQTVHQYILKPESNF